MHVKVRSAVDRGSAYLEGRVRAEDGAERLGGGGGQALVDEHAERDARGEGSATCPQRRMPAVSWWSWSGRARGAPPTTQQPSSHGQEEMHLYSKDVGSVGEVTKLFGEEKGLLVCRPGRFIRPWFSVPEGCYALATRWFRPFRHSRCSIAENRRWMKKRT